MKNKTKIVFNIGFRTWLGLFVTISGCLITYAIERICTNERCQDTFRRGVRDLDKATEPKSITSQRTGIGFNKDLES